MGKKTYQVVFKCLPPNLIVYHKILLTEEKSIFINALSLNAVRIKCDFCHVKDISYLQTSIALMNLTATSLCNLSDIPPYGIKNKAVVVPWGHCHFLEKAKIAQRGGAEALLVANNSILVSYEI